MRRPPVIIWKYLLTELWRLILLTAAILVTVLAFAAAVRFLADGRLGPVETIRLMFLAMPPMLQYALPFAAGFGATLAYHRAALDNELIAGHSAGISHRSILAPALLSGVILSITVLALSNFVIPRFLRSMEELVTRDAARLIVGSIERKEAVRMDNTLLYADLVRRYPPVEGKDYEQLYLQGVFVVEIDEKQAIRSQWSAREADVWLTRVDRGSLSAAEAATVAPGNETVTQVVIRSRGMVGQQRTGRMADESNIMSRTIPNAFTDDPKFLSWDELARLRREPERLNVIDSRRRVLASHLCERLTTGAIARALAVDGKISFEEDEETVRTVHASSIFYDGKRWVFSPGVGADGKPAPMLVERSSPTGRIVRQFVESATFETRVEPEAPVTPVTVALELTGITTVKDNPAARRDGSETQLKSQSIAGLLVPGISVEEVMAANSETLLAQADDRMKADPSDLYVKTPRDELRRRIADLMREVTSKQQERFASAAACLVMVLTGAVMAIKLRAKLPLEVYLWAFFPALATVIAISAGQQMIHESGVAGIPVMWAGVAILGVYTLFQFRQVARN